MTRPRPEYPRPQFVRSDWLNLNGEWQFEIDQADSGLERGLRDRELRQRIVVPFAPETTLSGIENVDFLEAVWYRTTVTVPAEWSGRDAVLHFQGFGEASADLIENEANQRLGARDVGGWNDQVE